MGNLSDLTWLCLGMIYWSALRLWTRIWDTYRRSFLVLLFGRPVLLCRRRMPWARGMAEYVRDGYGAFRQPKFECGCCEMMFIMVCCVRHNFRVISLYRDTDINDRIFDCLITSTTAVKTYDVHAYF